MTWRSPSMPARGMSTDVSALALVALVAFALTTKQALLEISDLGLCALQLSLQRRLTLCAVRLQLTQYSPVTIFTPRRTGHCAFMQALKVMSLHDQFDVLLLAQRDMFAGKWR